MADGPVISRAAIRAKARRSFDAGQSRDSHGFNPGADAIFDWLEEFDRLTRAAHASPASHTAPPRRQRVDVRQGVV